MTAPFPYNVNPVVASRRAVIEGARYTTPSESKNGSFSAGVMVRIRAGSVLL